MTTLATINALASPEVQMNDNAIAVSPAGLFGVRLAATTGLTWAYYGGIIGGIGAFTSIADGTVALTGSTTNYVEATTAGVVSKNTTGFTSGSVPLYEVTTSSSAVSSYIDRRILQSAFYTGPATMEGYTTTATAAGTTTLTVSSTRVQYFTGTSTQNCDLPVVSTLNLGRQFRVVNNSTGAVTVRSSGGNTIVVLAAGTSAIVTCILITGTSAASWSATYFGANAASGKVATISNTITLAGTDGTTHTFPSTSSTIARTDAAQTFTGVQTFSSQPIMSSLTASSAVATDGSKGLVSVTNTGTGNNVLSASPTFTGTIAAAALTTSGTVTHSGGTANGVSYLNGSKVLTTGSTLAFDGTKLQLGTSQNAAIFNVGYSGNNATIMLMENGTNGIRFGADASGGTFDAVDYTGVVAYKRIYFGGSEILLHISGADACQFNTSRALRLHAYGAGTLQTDASGNVTAVSDPDLKRRIRPYERGLAAVVALKQAGGVIQHGYTIGSGLDLSRVNYAGFDAAKVQPIFPEAVARDPGGRRTFDIRPIVGAHTNALDEVASRLARIEQHLSL